MFRVQNFTGNVNIASMTKFSVGDVLEIKYETRKGYWVIKSFIGICIAKKKLKENTKIILRNVINNVAVEINFFLYGENIVEVKKLVIKKNFKVFRGKLYYLRRKNLKKSKV